MKKHKEKDIHRIILFFIGVLFFEVYCYYSFITILDIGSMHILNSPITNGKLLIDEILVSLIWILPYSVVFNMIKNSIIQVPKFFKVFLIATIVSYILTVSFIIFSIILAHSSIYFKGYIFGAILLINFINVITWHIILMTICVKLIGEKLKDLKPLIKGFNILLLCILSVSLFFSSTFGGFFLVLTQIPNEIKVSHNNINYNIRKYGFLAHDEKDYNFIYNKSINLFIMKKLSDNEVPSGILAENNNYYYYY